MVHLHSEDAPHEPILSPSPAKRGDTILVVDDNASIVDFARRTLERRGYAVIVAFDGREAVEHYSHAAGAIDLVLLDMAMPVMDGAAALTALRQIDPGVWVLIVTGYPLLAGIAEEFSTNIAAVLAKPFSNEALILAVERALAERHL